MANQHASDLKIKVTSGSRSYNIHVSTAELNSNEVSVEIALPPERPVDMIINNTQNAVATLFQNMLAHENPMLFVQRLVNVNPEQQVPPSNIPSEAPSNIPAEAPSNIPAEPDRQVASGWGPSDRVVNQEVHVSDQHEYSDHDDDSDPESDNHSHHNDNEDNNYNRQLQQTLFKSMISSNGYESQSTQSYWSSSNHLSPEYARLLQFGNPDRAALSFAALIRNHPRYEFISTQLESLEMYREVFIVFDEWIRNAMIVNKYNAANLETLQCVDTLFGLHLLKFPKFMSHGAFAKLMGLFEPDESYNSLNARKVINILDMIREGILKDVVNLLDPGNCECSSCSA